MTLFWISAVLMVAAALAMVVPVLWRGRPQQQEADRNNQNVTSARERLAELECDFSEGGIDEAEFESAKQELERVLLDDLKTPAAGSQQTVTREMGRPAAIALVLLVPVITTVLYWQLGTPQFIGLETAVAGAADPHDAQGNAELPSMDEMVKRLAERLANEPDDAQGWFTLGRTYMSMERYAEAAVALEKVHALVGEHPAVMLALADALTMDNAGLMQGRPAELVRKAVLLAPDNSTALWLAGMVEEEEGNYAEAIAYWRKLEPFLIEQPQSLSEVRRLIAHAEKQLGGISGSSRERQTGSSTAVAPAAVQVAVRLDESLSASVMPGDTLFIYARAETGPPMPLAAVRKQASNLPLQVRLDDSMAMTPQMKLSSFDKVVVGARISRSGNAMKQRGDLFGETAGISVGNREPVTVIINQRVP